MRFTLEDLIRINAIYFNLVTGIKLKMHYTYRYQIKNVFKKD